MSSPSAASNTKPAVQIVESGHYAIAHYILRGKLTYSAWHRKGMYSDYSNASLQTTRKLGEWDGPDAEANAKQACRDHAKKQKASSVTE